MTTTPPKACKMHALLKPMDNSVADVYDNHLKIIYINPANREISYRKPSIFNIWEKFNPFLTDNQADVEFRNIVHRSTDLQSGGELQINTFCRVQLIPGMEYKAVTLLHREQDIDEGFLSHLANWIRLFTTKQDKFTQRFFELETEFITFVRQKASKHGFNIDLRFSPSDVPKPDGPQPHLKFEYRINCPIKDHDIDLKCTVLLNLENSRLYKMHPVQNMEAWIKKELVRIAQNEMIRKTFADLLQNPGLESIETELNHCTRQIGYTVTQLSTIAQIDEIGPSKDFDFSTEEGISYHTNHRDMPVKLRITVSGGISSFKGQIVNHLKPGVRITDTMRDQVIASTRLFMAAIDPARFYMYFNHPDEQLKLSSVENELVSNLQEMLSSQFNVHNPKIFCIPLNTRLIDRCNFLRSKFSSFTFENRSKSIKVNVSYRVEGVHRNGWHTFQALNFSQQEDELESINDALAAVIEVKLSSHTVFEILSLHGNDIEKFTDEIFDYAKDRIEKSHGLIVSKQWVKLLPTEVDETWKDNFSGELDEERKIQQAKQIKEAKKMYRNGGENPSRLLKGKLDNPDMKDNS